jgi:hypothetical protein
VLGALYCVAPWCLQRDATSEAGEEAGPPGQASANIEVKGERRVSVPSVSVALSPAAGGLPLLL